VHELTDEELLAAISAGPGAIREFYLRHVARVTGMGVRRFDNAEDVADFVATSASARRGVTSPANVRMSATTS
jgi:hypothetical protein